MSASITIELSPEALALQERFAKMPSEFPQAIKRGMTKALEVVTGRIIEKRLGGKGPFPVEEHRLGQVTQQLVRSTRPTPAVVISEGENVEVVGAIGASVIYAAVHEFGFHGEVRVKAFTRKIKSRNVRKGRKVIARGIGTVKAHTRTMNIPERAPFRTGIGENVGYIADEISKEIMSTLEGAE